MALRCLRLRRALTSLSALPRSLPSSIPPIPQPHVSQSYYISQSRAFTGTRVLLGRQYKLYKEGDEITEDTVLFAGCDYNHWLITMDFPKDPQPSSEEMVATYERTCAQGLNISIEEAKKRLYACSTTTYRGFQAVMTEEESEKFKDLPGVVFVLPDSYIDPVNEEYGGDKYENGVITPRPPPVQYQRSRNREPRFNRLQFNPRYNQQGSMHEGQMPNQSGNPQYNQQGFMQGGGRNYGPAQDNSPRQNYGPPGQGERMPMNNRDYAPVGREPYQENRGPLPSYQSNNNQVQQGNNNPQYQRDAAQGYYGNNNQGWQGNSHPQYQSDASQGYQGNNQGQQGNNYPQYQRNASQGVWGNYRSPGQGNLGGENASYSPSHSEAHEQGSNTGLGQGYPGDGRRF